MKNNIIKSFLSAAVCLMMALGTQAQHGLSYNQFGQVRNAFNGSLSIMDPNGGATILGRLQWIGMDGAPRSYWASGHVGVGELMTMGLDIKHITEGPNRDQEINAYLAKGIRLSESGYLSLSIGGGLVHHNGQLSKLDRADQAFRQDTRQTQGILSVGTSYFLEDRFYVGISMPRLILSKPDQDYYNFRQVYYATGGGLVRVDDGFHIRPSFTVGYTAAAANVPTEYEYANKNRTHYDINALAFFAQKFGLGLGVQSQGALSGIMQLNFGEFGFGYSYQFSTRAKEQRIPNGSHEFGLRYRVSGMKML